MTVRGARKSWLVIATVAGAVALVVGALLMYWSVMDGLNPHGGRNNYGMKDYTEQMQQEDAVRIVDFLNARNPEKFGIPIQDPDAKKAFVDNIEAVLPPPGCEYLLDGVEDKGELDEGPAALAPWYGRPALNHAVGFDMRLRQMCDGKPPVPRTIRVVAIPSGMGGNWTTGALYLRE